MLISELELKELNSFLEKWHEDEEHVEDDDWISKALAPDYFGEHPHLLMLLGFDEYRAFHVSDETATDVLKTFDRTPFPGDIQYESLFRLRESGVWKWFEGIATADVVASWGGSSEDCLHFLESHTKPKNQLLVPISQLIEAVRRAVANPPGAVHSIVLPKLWTPRMQRLQRLRLSENVGSLLAGLCKEEISLGSVTPRQLEEIIAELLRAKGMEIHVTPYTRDGGRDIIARGEIIPGEPCVLAVEVKKQPVTGLAAVQRALHANKDFSHLLVATSGRFSAGVVHEKRKPENEFRLLLKDGVGLKQWIDMYAIEKRS